MGIVPTRHARSDVAVLVDQLAADRALEGRTRDGPQGQRREELSQETCEDSDRGNDAAADQPGRAVHVRA